MTDKDFLRIAVEESKKVPAPYGFGAVIVKDGELIIAEHNHVAEYNDPSAHAEVTAIRAACSKLGDWHIHGMTMYTSHEPCMMCLCCAAWAQIDRIVFATRADELTEDMYEFRNAEFKNIASKLQRQIEVQYLPLRIEE